MRPPDVAGESMVVAEEFAVESLHGMSSLVTASWFRGRDNDLDTTLHLLVRFGRSQDAGDRVGEVPVEHVLELRVPQNREEFRSQV